MEDETLTEVQKRIESYLVEQVRDGESPFFKSRYIAEDLDMSSKTVGANLGLLQERAQRVSVQVWGGGSSGITWHITISEDEVATPTTGSDDEPALASAVPVDD